MSAAMINARIEVLSQKVLEKSRAKNIEVYTLKNSKANCIAFSSVDRRRREFEITFLKNSHYRVSTRFLGYLNVMEAKNLEIISDNDPDGRRKRFSVILTDENAVNRLVYDMLEKGYSKEPVVQLC